MGDCLTEWRTSDGCQWESARAGSTAELVPAGQTCQLAAGTIALSFWSMVSDGVHANSMLAGTEDLNGQPSNCYLYIGKLTKR